MITVQKEKVRNGYKIVNIEEVYNYIKVLYYDEKISLKNIGLTLGISDKKVKDILISHGDKIRSCGESILKRCKNENFFNIIDTEEKAYWLGFMYSDGFISAAQSKTGQRKFGLSIVDIEHLYNLKEALKFEGEVKIYKTAAHASYKETMYGRLLITSEKMVKDLINNGCLEHKTYELYYPTEKQVPKHLIKHFIRGYFDGDGSISDQFNQGKYYKIGINFQGTKEFLEGLKIELNKPNLKLLQRHPERDVNNYSLHICGNVQICKIMDWLYEDATIYLKRKHDKYLQCKETYLNSRANQ